MARKKQLGVCPSPPFSPRVPGQVGAPALAAPRSLHHLKDPKPLEPALRAPLFPALYRTQVQGLGKGLAGEMGAQGSWEAEPQPAPLMLWKEREP